MSMYATIADTSLSSFSLSRLNLFASALPAARISSNGSSEQAQALFSRAPGSMRPTTEAKVIKKPAKARKRPQLLKKRRKKKPKLKQNKPKKTNQIRVKMGKIGKLGESGHREIGVSGSCKMR
jgi:hypothetical protein